MLEASTSSITKVAHIGTASNHLKLGIVGTTNVGKSSLFNACVENASKFSEVDVCLFGTVDAYMGVFTPVDNSIDYIESIYAPKCTVRARCTIMDTAGIVAGSFLHVSSNGILQDLKHIQNLFQTL